MARAVVVSASLARPVATKGDLTCAAFRARHNSLPVLSPRITKNRKAFRWLGRGEARTTPGAWRSRLSVKVCIGPDGTATRGQEVSREPSNSDRERCFADSPARQALFLSMSCHIS